MTTANANRSYELNEDLLANDLPVKATTHLFEGVALGNSSGYAQELADGDEFLGFAAREADNSSGASGDIDVLVYQKGSILLTVTGVDSVDDVDKVVYCTGPNTFSLTDSGSDTAVGKVRRVVDTTLGLAMVRFEALAARSV